MERKPLLGRNVRQIRFCGDRKTNFPQFSTSQGCTDSETIFCMRFTLIAIATALLCAGMVVPVTAQTTSNHNKPAVSSQIAHGEYLVKNVAQCGDCHTPMNDHGEPVPGKWLQGSVLGFKPLVPMPQWASVAPGIAGLPGLTAKQNVDLLMTGVGRHGHPLRPPMPQFHMNRTDAEAVTAYLKSLK